MFRVGHFHFRDCLYVAENMRESDREELAAVRWDDADPNAIALDCEKSNIFTYIAYSGDDPVAVVGAMGMGPGVMSVFMFATKRLPEIGLGITRWVRRQFVPFLEEAGVHRAECHTLATHEDSHKWLRLFGMIEEAAVPGFGKNGELFYRYAVTRID